MDIGRKAVVAGLHLAGGIDKAGASVGGQPGDLSAGGSDCPGQPHDCFEQLPGALLGRQRIRLGLIRDGT